MTSPMAPQCLFCGRYRDDQAGSTETCEAYPEGIPAPIWDGRVDHRKPFKADGGRTFDPTDGGLVPVHAVMDREAADQAAGREDPDDIAPPPLDEPLVDPLFESAP